MVDRESRRGLPPWAALLAGLALLGVGFLRLDGDTLRSPWPSLAIGALFILVGAGMTFARRSLR